jgi:hypothetical protein
LKKHLKQKKQKSKKQSERESPIICGETMDLWIKLGKSLLRPKPEPEPEPLPKPEGRDALPPFLKNTWG